MSPRDRFLSHTRRDESGCLIWTGARASTGYGLARVPGVGMRGAHRAAWLILRGPIPDGMEVCHKCSNRLCVDVDGGHLYLGTHRQNLDDAIRSGTRDQRLTEADVLAIRAEAATGPRGTQAALARRFGVSTATIANVVTGKRRARLPSVILAPIPTPEARQ
jgi:hypothetical protein